MKGPFMSRNLITLIVFSILVSFYSCGKKPQKKNDEGNNNNNQHVVKPTGLTLVSPNTIYTHPQKKEDIVVLVLAEQVGILEFVPVHFSLIQAPQGAYMESETVLSDASGVATGVLYTGDEPATFTVKIEVEGVDPVAVTVVSTPITWTLQIVGSSLRSAYINQNITLQARIFETDTGIPVSGVDMTFKIPDNIVNPGGASTDPQTVTTDLQGVGTTTFFAGTEPANYTVEVSVDGVESQYFEIKVYEPGSCGGDACCQTDHDCGVGYQCIDGNCFQQDVHDTCTQDSECPNGWLCVAGYCRQVSNEYQCYEDSDCPANSMCIKGICKLSGDNQCTSDPDCQGGQVCMIAAGDGPISGICVDCYEDSHCPIGDRCIANSCEPIPQQDIIPDLEGLWDTAYKIDLTDALPLGLSNLGEPLNILDQILMGSFDFSSIPFIGSLIEQAVQSFIQNYIPPWVPEVVHVLDNIVNLFQVMTARGTMEVWHMNPPDVVHCEEDWEHIIVYWIEQCPQGRLDPNYPSCAELDIATGANTVEVEVLPFDGRIENRSNFIVDNRRVKIKMYQLVSYVVNLVIRITTGYNDLADMMTHVIDCQEVQNQVDSIACNIGWCGGVPGIYQACQAALQQVANQIMNQLAGIGVGWTVFEFKQEATIIDTNTNLPRPPATDLIGYDQSCVMQNGFEPECRAQGKGLEGDCNVVFTGDISGIWKGKKR